MKMSIKGCKYSFVINSYKVSNKYCFYIEAINLKNKTHSYINNLNSILAEMEVSSNDDKTSESQWELQQEEAIKFLKGDEFSI